MFTVLCDDLSDECYRQCTIFGNYFDDVCYSDCYNNIPCVDKLQVIPQQIDKVQCHPVHVLFILYVLAVILCRVIWHIIYKKYLK